MSHLPTSQDSQNTLYHNQRYPPPSPNVRLPFQSPPVSHIRAPGCFPPVQCPRNVVPNCVVPMPPSFQCPSKMPYPPPGFQPHEPPPQRSTYPDGALRFNVPPPMPPTQVYVPPYPPPGPSFAEAPRVPWNGNPGSTFPQNVNIPPSKPWHGNVQPIPANIPQNVTNKPRQDLLVPGSTEIIPKDKTTEFIEMCGYGRRPGSDITDKNPGLVS